jgi:hypothetical protein
MKPILLLAGLAGVVAATAVRDVRSLSVQSDAPYARVEVRGQCLLAGATTALGSPPRSDTDWQLRDLQEEGTAVWVAGRRPDACAGAGTDTTTYVVAARIFIDTVRVEAESTRRARLYLVGSVR